MSASDPWPAALWPDDQVSPHDGVVVIGRTIPGDRASRQLGSSMVRGSAALGSLAFAKAGLRAEDFAAAKPGELHVLVCDDRERELWMRLPCRIAAGMVLSAWGNGFFIRCAGVPAPTSVRVSEELSFVTSVRCYDCGLPLADRMRPSLTLPSANGLPAWLVRTVAKVADSLNADVIQRTAVEAGLRLMFDDGDGSHTCSQSIEGQGWHRDGDYWHAILHRCEPDYGNAKYWFRHVGSHPIFATLPREADSVRQLVSSAEFGRWMDRVTAFGRWDAISFVDCCEAAASHADVDFSRAVMELQYREMLHLLGHTCSNARIG